MKAPRREFVVEYKSTRRQTKSQPNSIWGNLDLGAVAREVDADGVVPAEQPIRPEPVELQQVEHTSYSNAVIDTATVLERMDDLQVSPDADPEIVDVVLPPDIDVPIDASPSAKAETSLPPRTRKRKSTARMPSPHSVRSPRASDTLNAPVPPVVLDDDIWALDAENRRLKRLMVDKLRSENGRLHSILDRLEKIPAIYLS